MLSKKIQEQINDLEKQLDEAVKLDLEAGIKEIFADFPNLQTLGWPQVTPSWNDGDPCHFSVHTDPDYSIYVNGNTFGDYHDSDEEDVKSEFNNLTKLDLESITNRLSQLLDSFNPEPLKRLFDEGLVTVTRDLNFDTDYHYDHY